MHFEPQKRVWSIAIWYFCDILNSANAPRTATVTTTAGTTYRLQNKSRHTVPGSSSTCTLSPYDYDIVYCAIVYASVCMCVDRSVGVCWADAVGSRRLHDVRRFNSSRWEVRRWPVHTADLGPQRAVVRRLQLTGAALRLRTGRRLHAGHLLRIGLVSSIRLWFSWWSDIS